MAEVPKDYAFAIFAGNYEEPESGTSEVKAAHVREQLLTGFAQDATNALNQGHPASAVVVETIARLEEATLFPSGVSAPVRDNGWISRDAGYHDGETDKLVVVSEVTDYHHPIRVASHMRGSGVYTGEAVNREAEIVRLLRQSDSSVDKKNPSILSIDGSVGMVVWDGERSAAGGSSGGSAEEPNGLLTLLPGGSFYANENGAAFVADQGMSRRPASRTAQLLVQALEGETHPGVLAKRAAERNIRSGVLIVNRHGEIGVAGNGDTVLVAAQRIGKIQPQVVRLKNGAVLR